MKYSITEAVSPNISNVKNKRSFLDLFDEKKHFFTQNHVKVHLN